MKREKKKIEINLKTIIQRDPNQEFTCIDGEVVMLSLKNAEYYGLDEVGTNIWNNIKEPITIENLCAILKKVYTVNDVVCLTDTVGFIKELYEKKILIIDNETVT